MEPIKYPKEPKPNPYIFISEYNIKSTWIPFIPWVKKEPVPA
tara:strand:- start:369 stop:494 length:126 start_codon:yes stop_codon:yes gene_type:complete